MAAIRSLMPAARGRALIVGGLPICGKRLTLARALLGGSATAALLPEIVKAHGGDAGTCLHLGALFAVGTLASEMPAAIFGDRDKEARSWLRRAGYVQAVALLAIALAPDLFALGVAVVLAGIGAGLATGAEARAALAIGRDAQSVARLEVVALLGKGTACFAIALLATALGIGARGAILASALLCIVAAHVAGALGAGDAVREVANGRRHGERSRETADRRSWRSVGVIALVVSVASLSLVARGTDPLDAFTVAARGGGLLGCAALLTAKGVIARALAPSIARGRMSGVAIAAALAALPLLVAPQLPPLLMLVTVAIACGIAGGAAAAARGVLLVRLGAARVGTGAAIEATVRRVAVALAALLLAPAVRAHGIVGPYAIAGTVAVIGGIAVLIPRGQILARRAASVAVATVSRN